jgi:CDP-glycerol glycerophosphotransferase (TagB/SpsB family)
MYLKAFPNYIFTFGRYDTEIPNFPFNRQYAIPVGNLELESKAKYYNEKLESYRKKKSIITFLSDNTPELISCAYKLSKILDLSQYEIKIKLHPSEYANWKNIYPFLNKSNINVFDDKKHNIYYFLAVSDYVIGCSSTTLFEATMFKCQIIILKVSEYFRSLALVEYANALLVEDEKDIAHYIIQKINTQKINSHYFFSNNSEKKIIKQISEIVNNIKED